MMQDYSTKSVHVEDMGLFVELAISLSRYFGRVTYSSPWKSAFPSSKETEVGEGITGVVRVDSALEVVGETDLFVYPDIYSGKDQRKLLDMGERVWGSRMADDLERYRSSAKAHFKSLGIPQGPYEVMRGVTKLRKYLQDHDGRRMWVKIDDTRGDTETFPVEGYEMAKGMIDELEFHLGPKAEILVFTVEDHLEGTIDLAVDTFNIDGEYPSTILLGTEEKGECYACVRAGWEEVPAGMKMIYRALAPDLAKYEYCNFISLESRVKGDEVLLGDPCMRGGSPPLELQLEMVTNLPDIMWYGAEDGVVVEPHIPSKYGVMLMVHSDWANRNPLLIEYPARLQGKLKFRYNSQFDGKTWIMPQEAGPRVAAIVEHGNDLEEIIEMAKEDSSMIKGTQVESFTRSFPIMMEKIEKLAEWGVVI